MIRRREFVRGLVLAGTSSLLGLRAGAGGGGPPRERTRIGLTRTASICWAPQYVAEELLHAEGFTDVAYVEMPVGSPVSKVLGVGQADVSMNFVGPNIIRVDQGDPAVFLAGAHVGCFEVFGAERVRKISDLK